MKFSEQEINHFWSKVSKGQACWLWQGGNKSHAVFNSQAKKYSAMRVAYFLTTGKLPIGRIFQSCGNKR